MKIQKWFWIIFAAAAIARIVALDQAGLWYDESFTAVITSMPLEKMFQAIAGDTHPPLYYLLLWVISHLCGNSAWVLRFPSVVFSMLSLWLAWKITRKIGMGETATLAAVGAMAIAPLQIHYAQEARMYAMLEAELLFALWAVLDRKWFLMGVSIACALYTHNYGLIFEPAIFLIGWVGEMRRPVLVPAGEPKEQECQARRVFWASLIPLALWVPWGMVLLHQMGQIQDVYWIQPVTPGSILYAVYMLFWAFSMPSEWQPIATLVTSGALCFSIYRIIQFKPRYWFELMVFAFLPLTLAVIGSALWQPILLFRGLIPSGFVMYLIISWAITRPPVSYRLYALALILPVFVAGLYGYYHYNPENKGDLESIASQIRQQWQPGDIVYHLSDFSVPGFIYYSPDLPQYRIPPCANTALGGLSDPVREVFGMQEKTLEAIPHRRAWLVWSVGPTSTRCEVEQGQPLIDQAIRVITVRKDEYIDAGVWLLDEQNHGISETH